MVPSRLRASLLFVKDGCAVRVKQSLFMLASCACLTGCGIIGNATHNVLTEIHQTEEDHQEHKRDRELADKAWAEWPCSRDEAGSEAFGDGFREGYADYLFAGGDGEPPAMPPRKYWRVSYETPDGRQATEDWFAGFRTGAVEARRSGLRQFVVLSTSVSCPTPPPAPVVVPVKSPPMLQSLPLPAPRPLPPPPPAAIKPAPMPPAVIPRLPDPDLVPEPAPVPTTLPKGTTNAEPAQGAETAPRACIIRVLATEPPTDAVIPQAKVLAVHPRPAEEN